LGAVVSSDKTVEIKIAARMIRAAAAYLPEDDGYIISNNIVCTNVHTCGQPPGCVEL